MGGGGREEGEGVGGGGREEEGRRGRGWGEGDLGELVLLIVQIHEMIY